MLLYAHKILLDQVCNHRSMVDDPAMMSSLLPFWMCLQLKHIRWGICTQNMLYKLKQSGVLHALAGENALDLMKSNSTQLYLSFYKE